MSVWPSRHLDTARWELLVVLLDHHPYVSAQRGPGDVLRPLALPSGTGDCAPWTRTLTSDLLT